MLFKVIAFLFVIGLVDSYGVPWYKHSHDDCEQDYPHHHPPSHSHGWNRPPPPPWWGWHPWHASGPHVITTYSPVIVYPAVHHEEIPTTTEVVTESPQGSINSESSGSGVLDIGVPAEDDSARVIPSPSPQESDSADSEVSTTEPVPETTPVYKVVPLNIKPAFYYKSYVPVHEGKYIAKTLGSVHIAPLQGHANSVTVLNAEPAPGTV